MLKQQHLVSVAVMLLLAMVLFNLPEQVAIRIKAGIGGLFLPLFGLAAAGQTVVDSGVSATVPRRALLRELANTRAENQQLAVRAMQGEEALRENERLRQLLGWQKQSPWNIKLARVIARDTAAWWRTLRIDLGTRDGLRPGLPVLVREGLIGKTGDVALTTSEVILIGDPNCRVAVLVRETGEMGVLLGMSEGVFDHRLVDLSHLPRNSSVKPGQTVYTSGLGGVFPAGLPVGTIVDSRSVGYGLYTEARVRLAADTSKTREVAVLFP
ncbi:MAG: rod shape-determining protein MreC [Verrucomicrobiota bacterium]|nr:rod shape-determining protein MreC [Verrucomicrobiota bacterium]